RGMDANEYALKVQPAAQSLAAAVRSAQWLGKGRALGRGKAPRREPSVVEPPAAVPSATRPEPVKVSEPEEKAIIEPPKEEPARADDSSLVAQMEREQPAPPVVRSAGPKEEQS